jgi:virginiamycin B lyase
MKRSLGPAHLRTTVALLTVLLSALTGAAPAHGYVYWANEFNPGTSGGSVGRANLDGTGPDSTFITNGAASAIGIAVNGGYIYIAKQNQGTIARAPLDGSAPVDTSFVTGANQPQGVAVDGTYVYWANYGTNSIGRARIDGQGVPDPNFIPSGTNGPNGPWGVAVDGSYIYWTNLGHGPSSYDRTIGRANLNGTSPDSAFITIDALNPAPTPTGVAVTASKIYWANFARDTVAFMNKDGTGGYQTIPTGSSTGPTGVAVDGSYVYWANSNTPTIGRATLDATVVAPSFINVGETSNEGVAVDSLVPSNPGGTGSRSSPSNAFTFRVKGRQLQIAVSAAGEVDVADAGAALSASAAKRRLLLKPSSGSGGAPAITVPLRLTKAGKRLLRSWGKARVQASITFTPQGGLANTQTAKLKITGKKKKGG